MTGGAARNHCGLGKATQGDENEGASPIVIPAHAGIHIGAVDSRFRGSDGGVLRAYFHGNDCEGDGSE